jgi:uncharacterized protein
MHSALYEGWLRHRRLGPRAHAFRQRLYMTYLDLEEIEEAFRGRWLWGTQRCALVRFRRKDYFGEPGTALADAIRQRVAQDTGVRPTGPIRVLTHLAHFGYSFNPVSFYYCFDAAGERVASILAEITNTPWGQRRSYVLRPDDVAGPGVRQQFAKTFHVSPFMPMALQYDWCFNTPGRALAVHMNVLEDGAKLFDATLALKRRAITGAALAATLLRFPAMPQRVVAGIYWQALRLYLKGAPFHAHPDSHASTPLSAVKHS